MHLLHISPAALSYFISSPKTTAEHLYLLCQRLSLDARIGLHNTNSVGGRERDNQIMSPAEWRNWKLKLKIARMRKPRTKMTQVQKHGIEDKILVPALLLKDLWTISAPCLQHWDFNTWLTRSVSGGKNATAASGNTSLSLWGPKCFKGTDLMHLIVVHWGLRRRHLQEHKWKEKLTSAVVSRDPSIFIPLPLSIWASSWFSPSESSLSSSLGG